MHSFSHAFMHSFIHKVSHEFIQSFIHSVIHAHHIECISKCQFLKTVFTESVYRQLV